MIQRQPGEELVWQLQQWAETHANESSGQLALLEYEPERYPGQDGVSVEGDPQSAAVIDSVALVAQPRYGEISTLLKAQEEHTAEVTRIGELLRGGNNVILATNHSDLIDIAVTHAAFYSLLDTLGYEPKTGIIISKMIAFLAYRLGNDMAPAVEVLKILENETFLSYPRTESANRRGFSRLVPSEVNRHNRQMRGRVERRLGEGSLLLAVAASGTTDKPSTEDPDTITMAGIGHGTYSVLSNPRTYVVPVAVWYGSETPVFEICDVPRPVQSEAEADNAMELISDTLSERVPHKTFVYNPDQGN